MALLIQRFGDGAGFLAAYNPDVQASVVEHRQRAFRGTAPTLGLVKATFGRGVAEAWLQIQLYDLAEYAGVRNKLSERQLNQLATVLLAEAGYFRVTEFMYFFHQLKAGKYGYFYGNVDPMVITTALKKFKEERLGIIEEYEREEQRKQRLELAKRTDVCTYDEYIQSLQDNQTQTENA